DDVSVGHGVSLLRWRSGGLEHPHDTPPYPFMPSPTSAHSSFALAGFLTFRLGDVSSHHFSVHDVLNVLKAVVVSELATSVVLFPFTRLEGIPRSTPLIHALVLAAGLIAMRALIVLAEHQDKSKANKSGNDVPTENILMIGMTRLSSI